jgi:hypothetical protein
MTSSATTAARRASPAAVTDAGVRTAALDLDVPRYLFSSQCAVISSSPSVSQVQLGTAPSGSLSMVLSAASAATQAFPNADVSPVETAFRRHT